MARSTFRWVRRLAVAVAVGGVVYRVARRASKSPTGVPMSLPTIGGDTWPPVPVNPNHQG